MVHQGASKVIGNLGGQHWEGVGVGHLNKYVQRAAVGRQNGLFELHLSPTTTPIVKPIGH